MVAQALQKLDLEPEHEVRVAEGYTLDLVVEYEGVRIGVEVDGPTHFLGDSEVPNGATALKHRQLRSLGWPLLSVPYFSFGADDGGFGGVYSAINLRASLDALVDPVHRAYRQLGLKPSTATMEDVKKEYRERLLLCHPDLHPGDTSAAQQTQLLNEAYALIERTPPQERARAAAAVADAARVASAAAVEEAAELRAVARRYAREWVSEQETKAANEAKARAAAAAKAVEAEAARQAEAAARAEAAEKKTALKAARRRQSELKQANASRRAEANREEAQRIHEQKQAAAPNLGEVRSACARRLAETPHAAAALDSLRARSIIACKGRRCASSQAPASLASLRRARA